MLLNIEQISSVKLCLGKSSELENVENRSHVQPTKSKSTPRQKKNGLSNPKSIMALAAGRSHRIFFGKGIGQNLFDKSLQNPNALANFDACVEACDALTASSGRVSSTSLDQFSNEHDLEKHQ